MRQWDLVTRDGDHLRKGPPQFLNPRGLCNFGAYKCGPHTSILPFIENNAKTPLSQGNMIPSPQGTIHSHWFLKIASVSKPTSASASQEPHSDDGALAGNNWDQRHTASRVFLSNTCVFLCQLAKFSPHEDSFSILSLENIAKDTSDSHDSNSVARESKSIFSGPIWKNPEKYPHWSGFAYVFTSWYHCAQSHKITQLQHPGSSPHSWGQGAKDYYQQKGQKAQSE